MSEKFMPGKELSKEDVAVELTRFLVRKHYCENDFLSDESVFDEPFLWFGAAEQEFASGKDTVLDIFRMFKGKVPKCNISEEEYRAGMVSPDICLVAGRMWISTDPSTGVFLQVHQRITTCIKWTDGNPKCCMIHISNPYTEMASEDVGFPTRMAEQSREYMQRELEAQKEEIRRQADELSDIYNTVSCGILRLRRKKDGYQLLTFNKALADLMDRSEENVRGMDWSQGFGEDAAAEDITALRAGIDSLKNPGDRTSSDYRITTGRGRVVHLTTINDFIKSEAEGDIIQRLIYDISDRIELERKLHKISFEDNLTGLYNRNRFNRAVEEFKADPAEHLGVAVLDINGLKDVNDSLGHMAGDDLLRRTGANIREIFPGKGYRTGGDEFVIIDRDSEMEEFGAKIAAVRRLMARDEISISVGVCWNDGNCDVWNQCERADRRMYKEKKEFYRQISMGGGYKEIQL